MLTLNTWYLGEVKVCCLWPRHSAIIYSFTVLMYTCCICNTCILYCIGFHIDLEEMNRRKYLARAGLQREGYHSVPFNVGKTSTNLSGCANDTQTNNHTFPSSSTAGMIYIVYRLLAGQ